MTTAFPGPGNPASIATTHRCMRIAVNWPVPWSSVERRPRHTRSRRVTEHARRLILGDKPFGASTSVGWWRYAVELRAPLLDAVDG